MQCMLSFLKKTHQVIYITQSFTRKKKNEEKMKRQKFNIQNTKSTLHSYTRATKSK